MPKIWRNGGVTVIWNATDNRNRVSDAKSRRVRQAIASNGLSDSSRLLITGCRSNAATLGIHKERLMPSRPCRLLCRVLDFLYSAGFVILIFIAITIISRKSPGETFAGKRFRERSRQRGFRFSHLSVSSDTKFQAEQIVTMAGDRSIGVPEI